MIRPLKIAQKACFYSIIGLFIIPSTTFASFNDVSVDHPQAEAIEALETQGVIGGYNRSTFRPDALVTRAELLKILFGNIGFKPDPNRKYQTKFKDVPEDSWFAPYVNKAIDLRILDYNPDVPFFYPDQPVSKIDAVKLIMPIEGIPAPYIKDSSPLLFSDVNPNSSFSYLVRAAENAGLYFKEDNNKFLPYKNLTRAEAVGLIYLAQLYRQEGPISSTIIIQSSDGLNAYGPTEQKLLENSKFPILLSAWTKINEQYLDKDKLDQNKLVYGAVSGMVNALDDPYSVYDPPTEATQLQDNLSGTYEGIGTVLDKFENNYIIVSLITGSPAEKAGLKPGDIIKKVDGKDIQNLDSQALVNLIKGPAGSSVELIIDRDGQSMTFNITRASVTLDSVGNTQSQQSHVTIPENIGFIAISQFTENTDSQFDDMVTTTMKKNPKGIILDLRDNPGGYLDPAYNILGHFVENGKPIMYLKISGTDIIQKSDGKGELKAVPIIVLVNKNSASAAEVVAGALQDYKVARLIGETTYGKGTVQEVTTYADGSLLKLSVARWLTPLKRDINKIGLTPDIEVKATKDDILGKTDTQLQKAVDEMAKL